MATILKLDRERRFESNSGFAALKRGVLSIRVVPQVHGNPLSAQLQLLRILASAATISSIVRCGVARIARHHS
jgi:hypothetical protein